MQRRFWTMRQRFTLTICLLVLWGTQRQSLTAQELRNAAPTPIAPQAAFGNPVTTEAPSEVIAAPILAPAESLSLEQCINLGMQHQPSLAAARASLSAAQSGSRSVDRLLLPRLFTPDLAIRRQQACQGVSIASAGLTQAEWDMRYSVTRNFFTVQYVRSQQEMIESILNSLAKAKDRANKIFKQGLVDSKITQLDLEAIDIQISLIQAKKAQADNGLLKAMAALREAMGVRHDYVLNIPPVDLPPATYKFDKESLIASALANRGEITQVNAASRVTELEIQAQSRIRGWQGKAFPISGDIHAKQVPQGVFNNEYRPGADALEYPPMLIGRKFDRVDRANAFHERALAVVDKTQNLVSLDVEAMFLKWQEAASQIANYTEANKLAQPLLDKIVERSNKTPGELTSSSIIQASTTAIMVRSQLNEAKHIHALALAGLERATAGAFSIYPIPGAAATLPNKK